MKPLEKLALVAAFVLCMVGVAKAQTAGVVNLSVTPTSGDGSVTPRATWSSTPAASSCKGSWTTTALAASGSATLPAITSTTDVTVTCTWPSAAGQATVSWAPPTANTDGSPLTDLAGFKIIFGTSVSNMNLAASVNNAGATSATVGSLTPNTTYFFTVRAVNAKGTESASGNVVSKLIAGGTPPAASKTVTVVIDKVPAPPTEVKVVETTAYNVRPNLQRFVFERGSKYPGVVRIGAACDESRTVGDGYYVISRLTMVSPRPAAGTVLVARCG